MIDTGVDLVIGIVLPPIIDLVVKYIKNSTWRYVVSLVICLIIGAVLNINKLTLTDILSTGAIIFATAQTVYKTYWKESEARTKVYGDKINQ